MYLIIASKEDPASMNIKGQLLELATWKEEGSFEREPVYRLLDKGSLSDLPCGAIMVTIEEIHILSDDIDKRATEALGLRRPETVIFLSRHKSESGLRTLTVHAIGCYGTAEYGGRPRTLVPSAPGPMNRALRSMAHQVKVRGLEFKVSFECTHHGPYLETPSFFIEIGSSEEVWTETPPAQVLANVVIEVVSRTDPGYPVAIGVGGGHYSPRFTEVALGRKVSFGHMVPNYALENASDEILKQTVDLTPGAKLIYFHRKSLKGGQYSRLKELYLGLGLEHVKEKDLQPL